MNAMWQSDQTILVWILALFVSLNGMDPIFLPALRNCVVAVEIPDIISGGESGGSFRVGIPWPKQSGNDPITAIKYTVDGGNEVQINLDGKESPSDGTDAEKRAKLASKRLFQNFLRTAREESIQRSNGRANELTCPVDHNIAFGFALQFSSTEDEGVRQYVLFANTRAELHFLRSSHLKKMVLKQQKILCQIE